MKLKVITNWTTRWPQAHTYWHLHTNGHTKIKKNRNNYIESTLETLQMSCERWFTKSANEIYQSVADALRSSEHEPILDAQNTSGEYLELGPDDSPSGMYGQEVLGSLWW